MITNLPAVAATLLPVKTAQEFHDELHKLVGSPKNNYKIRKLGKRTIRTPISRAHSISWAETIVNLQARIITVHVYLDLFQDEDLSDTDYKRIKQLVVQSINRYWSKQIVVGKHLFSVQVVAKERGSDSVTARLMYHKMRNGNDYVRSFNLGFWGLSNIVYNEFPGKGTRVFSDTSFMITCAHEFGHSVLMAFGGAELSWGHKGSTHIIPQSVKSATPGYPASGEIDLMKYYDGNKQAVSLMDKATRTKVSDQDIMRLIWLSTITF